VITPSILGEAASLVISHQRFSQDLDVSSFLAFQISRKIDSVSRGKWRGSPLWSGKAPPGQRRTDQEFSPLATLDTLYSRCSLEMDPHRSKARVPALLAKAQGQPVPQLQKKFGQSFQIQKLKKLESSAGEFLKILPRVA